MVFSRFISFSLGVLSGIYITQNYNDVPNLENLTNEDEPFYNEIAGALDFFDKNIEAMENAHRSITNMANIDS